MQSSTRLFSAILVLLTGLLLVLVGQTEELSRAGM